MSAYPNFIGFSYQSCMTCHYNPHGNGPLTDYGRALSATVISDRSLYSAETTDDMLGKKSSYLRQELDQDWFRPSANYRGLKLKRNYGSKNEQSEYIHMMANVNAVFRLGPQDNRDKIFTSVSFGYAPKPSSQKSNTEPEYRSREHYIGYRPTPNWGLYAGMMDIVFGIRVADHIAFSRTLNSLTQNDQTHGVLAHYIQPEYELSLQLFGGNLSQEANLRQKGLAVSGEWGKTMWRIGGSFKNSSNEFLSQSSVAAHSRIGFGKGNSLLIEFGQVNKKVTLRNTNISSQYIFAQGHILAKRGLFLFNTIEYLKADTKKEDHVFRLGPGIQYFAFHGLELRFDAYNTRVFSESSVSEDSWSLAGQLHLWL